LEVEELPLTIPYFKRPRFEKIEAEYKQKEITKENSFFLGIKKAFEATKMDKTVEDVWNFLEKNHPQRIPDQKEIVLLISQKDFLHAALLFLSNPFGKRKCSINQKQFSSVWQREYLEYNENKKTFKWKETTTTKQQIELETVCLMGLELIFRQPPKLDPTTLYGKKAYVDLNCSFIYK
jgi:hypothetical protein